MNITLNNQQDRQQLFAFYQQHLTEYLLPFWRRALDEERGGVYTCFNNFGTELTSKDKYTWSQGRFVWVWSRLAELCRNGKLNADADAFLAHAKKTVDFISEHAFLDGGNCAFLLTETGEKKESISGKGYDTSFYADCFVVLGFAEYARVSQDRQVLEQAVTLHENIVKRLEAGNVRSEPYPVPTGYTAHGPSMIMLNVTQELADALQSFHDARFDQMRNKSGAYMREIMETFYFDDGKVAEIVPEHSASNNTILARHLNPGHAIESMWFVMTEAQKVGRRDWIDKAAKVIKTLFDLGWDAQYGGLLHYVDRDGGEPKGEHGGGAFEKLVQDTWGSKLWWVHSEALYSTLLAHDLTGDDDFLKLYDRTHDYTFQTFPNPDKEVGEWIQICDRQGSPVQQLVALPVKDPYHIIRNVVLIMELLS